MATQEARMMRAEMRENGFLMVNSMARTFRRRKSALKGGRHHVEQESADPVAFKVVRRPNGAVNVWKKSGSEFTAMRAYYWTGVTLQLLTVEMSFRRNVEGVDGMELYQAQNRPSLTHEQLCDVQRALIRL